MSQAMNDARSFVYKDANGRDQYAVVAGVLAQALNTSHSGVNVRHRAAALLALLHDHEGLRAARAMVLLVLLVCPPPTTTKTSMLLMSSTY